MFLLIVVGYVSTAALVSCSCRLTTETAVISIQPGGSPADHKLSNSTAFSPPPEQARATQPYANGSPFSSIRCASFLMKPLTANGTCSTSSSVYFFSTCVVAFRQGFRTRREILATLERIQSALILSATACDFFSMPAFTFPRMIAQFRSAGFTGSGILKASG